MADSKHKRKVDHIYCFIISTVLCCFKPLGKLLETKYVDIYIVSWFKETGGFAILGLTLSIVHNIIERMRAFSCSLYAWVQCCSVLILLTVGCKSRALWILFLDDGCWGQWTASLLYPTTLQLPAIQSIQQSYCTAPNHLQIIHLFMISNKMKWK